MLGLKYGQIILQWSLNLPRFTLYDWTTTFSLRCRPVLRSLVTRSVSAIPFRQIPGPLSPLLFFWNRRRPLGYALHRLAVNICRWANANIGFQTAKVPTVEPPFTRLLKNYSADKVLCQSKTNTPIRSPKPRSECPLGSEEGQNSGCAIFSRPIWLLVVGRPHLSLVPDSL